MRREMIGKLLVPCQCGIDRMYLSSTDTFYITRVYTRSILETLRLWPTVRSQLRECLKSVTIGGVDVQKGTQLLLSNSVLQRPLQSSTAHRFNPANFSHPEDGGHHPHIVSFNAFGGGSQDCPGRDVATLFMTEILYFILQNWTFVSHNKQFLDLDHVLLDIDFTNVKFKCTPRC